jgi:general secretion pathway protein D
MKNETRETDMKHRLAVLCVACALVAGATSPVHAQRSKEPITLNFVNADIEAVARTMAAITGRNIVVDPRVKGTINLSTDRPVAPAAAYEQFLATLRLSGFAVVEAGGLLKVVPEADAKLQGGAVSIATPAAGNQIVTQIFRLNYESAGNLVPILRPLINPNNTINVDPGNNSLVVTDYTDNLQRIARIIAALDVSNATDVEVIPLRHALAPDLGPIVQRLVDSSSSSSGSPVAGAQGQAEAGFRTTVIPEVRSNSLLVRASNAARMNLVRSLVEKLDQPASQSATGNIYVVYLKNAEATKLAVTLRAALAATSPTGGGAASGGTSPAAASSTPSTPGASPATTSVQASAQPSTGGQIQADPATNSLIITAAEPQYRQLRAVIDRLDQRRAQVLVESLIVEVNADKAAQFGIQWQGALGNAGSTNIGLLGTNFSTGSTANIIDLALNAANGTVKPSTGGNYGIAHKTNGVYVLGFLANFLQTNGDGNVLSTPNLLTVDNEEAKIVIGENVPFVTGQFTNTGASNGSVNPFQTIERKDVGLTLRVKPQINENGTVRLVIFQETSSVKSGTEAAANGPTTTKRSIESTVLVDDGNIVVLGGLLQDQYSANQDKVPVLGDVPLFGNLFKSETRSRNKTNLMVFLRPVVVRDSGETAALSLNRYDLMRATQQQTQPVSSIMIPVNEAPVLLPLQTKPAAQPPLGVTSPAPAPAPATR